MMAGLGRKTDGVEPEPTLVAISGEFQVRCRRHRVRFVHSRTILELQDENFDSGMLVSGFAFASACGASVDESSYTAPDVRDQQLVEQALTCPSKRRRLGRNERTNVPSRTKH